MAVLNLFTVHSNFVYNCIPIRHDLIEIAMASGTNVTLNWYCICGLGEL